MSKSRGYRSTRSYIAKDPEARANQLANLRRGNKPGTLQKSKEGDIYALHIKKRYFKSKKEIP